MWIFHSIFGKIFDVLFFPFHSLSPWAGMTFISLLTGLFMLLVFRVASDQEGIREVKNKIKAHLLELRLYKDSLSLSLKSQGSILRYNLRYISYSAKPMLIMIIPLILIIVHLNIWFGYQSLTPGDQTLLKVKLKEGWNPLDLDLLIKSSPAFKIETPSLRIEEGREINWRFRVKNRGVHNMILVLNGRKLNKKIAVAQNPLSKISPIKIRKNFMAELLHPGETPLPSDSPLKSIEIIYPSKNMNLFGWSVHWIIVYFALSVIFGFALKGILKVEI